MWGGADEWIATAGATVYVSEVRWTEDLMPARYGPLVGPGGGGNLMY